MSTWIHSNLYLNILDTDLETLDLENLNFLNNNATLVIHLVTHSPSFWLDDNIISFFYRLK